MTIRLADLTIDPTFDTWLDHPDAVSALDDLTRRNDLLSIVRHIMRDEPCSIVPIVRAFIVHDTNQWGHNAQVEVTYSKRGYRAIYGAHLGATVTKVQCYMD